MLMQVSPHVTIILGDCPCLLGGLRLFLMWK